MAASFADLLTFPLDTAKVRLQVGALGQGSLFASKEGLRSLPQHLYRLPTSSSSHTTLSRPLTPLLPTLPCYLPITIAQDKKILIPWHDVTGPSWPALFCKP